ncbi:MAG: 16S rRNA (cytosine(1402)-N(4))-methyltransferase RsmH [Bacteroidia bacterium]
MYHRPVLLKESIEGLNIVDGGTYVDATFGGGGHTNAILKKLKSGRVIAFDQDKDAFENISPDTRLIAIHSNFRYIKEQLMARGITQVDGILADLGISSHQIDTPERGFSTRFDALLDMRMNSDSIRTAADIINTYPAARLQKMFSVYGEITNAANLARNIEKARSIKPVRTTADLIEAINGCTPPQNANKYLAQVFQSLRIELNEETDALKELLSQSETLIKKGGRLVVISYHSLEDRLVKNYMRSGNFEGVPQKNMYGHDLRPFEPITKKPIVPGEEEIVSNNRARSAKMRIAEKI